MRTPIKVDLSACDFIYLLREARHMGYAVRVDTIRLTSIDKEIRDVSDYIFIKRVGVQGLPKDLRLSISTCFQLLDES